MGALDPCPRGGDHDRIMYDLECVTCRYNLKALLPDGRCPECGTFVAVSLQETRIFGRRGRRSFFLRSLMMNAIALYVPGIFFLILMPVTGLLMTLALIAVSPLVLLAMLFQGRAPTPWVPMLIAAAAVSAALPYLAARVAVGVARHSRVASIIPVALFTLTMIQVVLCLLIIGASG